MSTIKVQNIQHTGSSTNAIALASDGTCTANITNNLSSKNKIINGSMIINQREGSTAYSGSDFKYGALDRYKIRNTSDGAYTISQTSSVYPPTFRKSLKLDVTTADTTITGAQTVYIAQFVEAQDLQNLAYGTSSAKSITISFYVRSNKTGTYAMRVQQADNGFKQAGFNYTINTADTWERKTFTLVGDTSGVIADDNGTGLEFYWILAAGPTYQGGNVNSTYANYSNADFAAGQTVNILDNTSNEFYLTGIQVEVSDHATDFEHRSFAQELALCQRYYQKIVEGNGKSICENATQYNGSYLFMSIPLPVAMRAAPTLEDTNASNHFIKYANGSSTQFDTFGLDGVTTKTLLCISASVAGTGGHSNLVRTNSNNAFVAAVSEL